MLFFLNSAAICLNWQTKSSWIIRYSFTTIFAASDKDETSLARIHPRIRSATTGGSARVSVYRSATFQIEGEDTASRRRALLLDDIDVS
jgi:hypothetical protein